VDFWNALNMRPLSLNDDSLNEEDDRQKTQGGGSRNKSNKILNKKKKQCNCSSLSASNDCLVG